MDLALCVRVRTTMQIAVVLKPVIVMPKRSQFATQCPLFNYNYRPIPSPIIFPLRLRKRLQPYCSTFSAAAAAAGGDPDAIILHVGGMMCEGCAANVKRILEGRVLPAATKVNSKQHHWRDSSQDHPPNLLFLLWYLDVDATSKCQDNKEKENVQWSCLESRQWSCMESSSVPSNTSEQLPLQPQVSSATVNLASQTAIVIPVFEEITPPNPNWHNQLGEALAHHLTTSGFNSTFPLPGQEDTH